MKLLTKLFSKKPNLTTRARLVGLCNECARKSKCKTAKYVEKHKKHKFIKSCSNYDKCNCGNCSNGANVLSEKYNTKSAMLRSCRLTGIIMDPHAICHNHTIGGR